MPPQINAGSMLVLVTGLNSSLRHNLHDCQNLDVPISRYAIAASDAMAKESRQILD